MSEQPVANTDRELYREPSPDDGFGMDAHQPSVHVTADGQIGMCLGGLAIVRSVAAWHHAAQVADAVARTTCLGCGHAADNHATEHRHGGDFMPPASCAWPGCFCREMSGAKS